jgi:hypothetical protein
MTTNAAPATFSRQEFKQKLANLPPDILFEIAHDGKVNLAEIHRLLALLGFDKQTIDAMQPHYHLIGETVLRTYARTYHQSTQKGVCALMGVEAVSIMITLLERGLISRYYDRVVKPTLQHGLPAKEISTTRTKT